MPRRKEPPTLRWCAWCGATLRPDDFGYCNQNCADDYTSDLWRELRQQRASAVSSAAAVPVPRPAFPPKLVGGLRPSVLSVRTR